MKLSNFKTTTIHDKKYDIVTGYNSQWSSYITSIDHKRRLIVWSDIYISKEIETEFLVYFENGKDLP